MRIWACVGFTMIVLQADAFRTKRQAGEIQSDTYVDVSDFKLLSLTDYKLACRWYESCKNVYASFEVQPSGKKYAGKVLKANGRTGNLDTHLYIPKDSTGVSVRILSQLWWSTFDKGGFSVDLSRGGKVTWSLGKAGATVEGNVAMGKDVAIRASEAQQRGAHLIVGDPLEGDRFVLHAIRNDEVENELAYPKTGSAIPKVLQGIFWMDQRGKHLPIASDPDYKQVGPNAADELLVTLAEHRWNPDTLCLEDAAGLFGGAPIKGHWTWMNNGAKNNIRHAGALLKSVRIDFCFRDETFQAINLHMYVKAKESFGFNVPGFLMKDGLVEIPRAAMALNMIKKPWGWDRESIMNQGAAALRSILPDDLGSWLDEHHSVYHYPLFQIVDGDGKRTEHYEAYLTWANTNFPDCSEKAFDCPLNKGNGTQLVARRAL